MMLITIQGKSFEGENFCSWMQNSQFAGKYSRLSSACLTPIKLILWGRTWNLILLCSICVYRGVYFIA